MLKALRRHPLLIGTADAVRYTNVTGDLRQANYSRLREGKLEFRRRIEQFQHNTLVFQLCRRVWNRWIRDAVLSRVLDLPDFAENPAPHLAVKWIPPKWNWVDPLKDRKAEIEAGLKSVLLLYWTVWVDPNGQISFRRDIYERDRQVLHALNDDFRPKPLLPDGVAR